MPDARTDAVQARPRAARVLGEAIRAKLRQSSYTSQAALARAVHCSESTVSALLNAERNVPWDTTHMIVVEIDASDAWIAEVHNLWTRANRSWRNHGISAPGSSEQYSTDAFRITMDDLVRNTRTGTGARRRSPRRHTEPHQSPWVHTTVLRMALGEFLKDVRQRLDVDRYYIELALDWPEGLLAQIESGCIAFDDAQVLSLLRIYEVSDLTVVNDCVDLTRMSGDSGLRTRDNHLLPEWFEEYVDPERYASTIRCYDPILIPPFLQTAEYSAATSIDFAPITSPYNSGQSASTAKARKVEERRQARPTSSSPSLWAIIDYSALLRMPLNQRAKLEQIDYLVHLARKSNVALQIITSDSYRCPRGFTLLRSNSPNRGHIVLVEDITGGLYLDTANEVDQFVMRWDRMAVEALSPGASIEFLENLRYEGP